MEGLELKVEKKLEDESIENLTSEKVTEEKIENSLIKLEV